MYAFRVVARRSTAKSVCGSIHTQSSFSIKKYSFKAYFFCIYSTNLFSCVWMLLYKRYDARYRMWDCGLHRACRNFLHLYSVTYFIIFSELTIIWIGHLDVSHCDGSLVDLLHVLKMVAQMNGKIMCILVLREKCDRPDREQICFVKESVCHIS